MKIINSDAFIKKSTEALREIFNYVTKLSVLQIKDLDKDKAVLVIVDMINGFAREGALKSTRVEELIPEIARLSALCSEHNIKKLAFADCHTEVSPEFGSYPPHCLAGSSEGEIVEEIKNIGGYTLISKNSTNSFIEEGFQSWLKENHDIDTFIITGDCTDICVQQFAVTLKAWFDMKNKKSRIIVPINTVDTYDLGMHDADLMNVMALYSMSASGIELVGSIENEVR